MQLMLQQPFLSPQPPGITGKASVTADHPVTGYDDGHGVLAIGVTHRPYRPGVSKPLGDILVRNGMPEGNAGNFLPHPQLKLRAGKIEVQVELLKGAIEIGVQLLITLLQE